MTPYLRPASERLAPTAGIEPVLVLAILTAITQIAAACMTPAEAANTVRRMTWLQRRKVENAIWRGIPEERRQRDYHRTVRAVINEIKSVTADDVQSAYADLEHGTKDFGD